jgi:predicted dinucleotide-binding enzyme
MNTIVRPRSERRRPWDRCGAWLAVVMAVGAACALPLLAQGGAAPRGPLKIGVIGSGNQGGTIGLLWAKAGHEVLFSSRHPEQLKDLVAKAGPKARAGLPQEAAAFGDVVLVAVPYGALPQVGRDHAALLKGKIVIECGNPREDRDGPMAKEAIAKGTGVASAEYLPGVRLVRAFSAGAGAVMMPKEAHRPGEKIGIPIAGDDQAAVATVARLVTDAGFDPVVVGPLARAREFDRGTAVYGKGAMTARQWRDALGLPQP